MVRKMLVLLLWMAFTVSIAADEIKVSAEIESDQAYENQPLKGLVMVTHDQNEKVDTGSFRFGKETIAVDLVQEMKMESNNPLVVSIYSFQMPTKPAGLYILPEISVVVGGKRFKSIMSSYEVKPSSVLPSQRPSTSQPAVPSKSPSIGNSPQPASSYGGSLGTLQPVLRIEASVDGKADIYPGQRTKLAYHYFYNGNIELVTETLPLLDAVGLIKIGEKEFSNYTQGNLSVNEISQQVEGVKSGTFSFGPSLIEGYTYVEDPFGTRKYTSPKLSSEAPAVVITVLPFPKEGKPSSFNGAIGSHYQFKAAMVLSSQVEVGDEIALSLTITGQGNIKNVPLPDICCQPGFSGFFKVNDLPPEEKVEGESKKAIVKLRPLVADIKEIPAIEFSFFNPATSQYEVLHSVSMPLHVNESHRPAAPNFDKAEDDQKEKRLDEAQKPYPPSPIEIQGIYNLSASDVRNKPFGTWWTFAIVPMGIALIAYQIYLQAYLEAQRKRVKVFISQDLLQKAFQQKEGSSAYFELINQGLKLALFEAGIISSAELADEDLPSGGIGGRVREFLIGIAEMRFTGQKKINFGKIRSEALAFLEEIKSKGKAS